MANNWLGVYIDSSSSNSFYHNNLADNTNQVQVDAYDYLHQNTWDNGIEGNFWKDYVGIDSDFDGIGDVPYVIDSNNTDHYPLIGKFSRFETSPTYTVELFSNSTTKNFTYSASDRKISFDVEGQNGTIGFCTLIIPHELVNPAYLQVIIDNGNTAVHHPNCNLHDNQTHRWVYFAYSHSTHNVVIQEDTSPPAIFILSPENKTYDRSVIPLTFTTSENLSWSSYSLDASTNVTIMGNTTLPSLPDGTHSIIIFANDTVGNMGKSDTVTFTIDTTPPFISIISPENKTYATRNVTLVFTTNGTPSWIGYSLDGENNITIAQNITLTDLADGSHRLIVYAADAMDNTGSSNVILFTVDSTPPTIVSAVQLPPKTNVLPEDIVSVNVTITDNVTGVRNVSLTYAYVTDGRPANGSIVMTEVYPNVWTATIPPLPYGTNVSYTVIASDNAGNTVTTEQLGYVYQYTVVPEYPFHFILLLFMTGVLTALFAAKRKRRTPAAELTI